MNIFLDTQKQTISSTDSQPGEMLKDILQKDLRREGQDIKSSGKQFPQLMVT